MPPSTDVRSRLEAFADLLRTWNKTINLIGAADLPDLWRRHIEDSLQLGTLGPLPGRAIDLGSGAGFPGLILAIAFGIRFDLIEQDRRKAAFLQEAIFRSGAPARVFATKIEKARVEPAPLITSRALAPLPVLLRYAVPLLAGDGICLFPKSRAAEAEIEDAERDWTMRIERLDSVTDPEGMILRLSGIRPRG